MAKYNFNAELYDNPLTEKEGDYIARPTFQYCSPLETMEVTTDLK